MAVEWDLLITNVHLATMAGEGYGEIRDAAIAVDNGRIAWIGRREDAAAAGSAELEHDGGGAWLTP